MPIQYGYSSYSKPPAQPKIRTSGLALAASGNATDSNPFGFRTAKNTTGFADPVSPSTSAAARRTTPTTQVKVINTPGAQQQQPAAPPTPGGYDINTDPALQQINALTGMSDEQANAAALKQRQQQILGYGDPNLALNVLGDQNLAQAAGGNPTSTLAQLRTQHDRNTHDLTEGLNQQNLLYSGYRTVQEQQAAQDYQNQLANAAAGVNGNLDAISGNLAAALSQNQQQRIAAEQAARDRALQQAIQLGVPGGTAGADQGAAPVGGDTGPAPSFIPPSIFDAIAAAAQSPAAASASPPGSEVFALPGANEPLPLLSGTTSFGGNQPAPSGTIPNLLSALANAAQAQQNATGTHPYGNAAQRRRQAL